MIYKDHQRGGEKNGNKRKIKFRTNCLLLIYNLTEMLACFPYSVHTCMCVVHSNWECTFSIVRERNSQSAIVEFQSQSDQNSAVIQSDYDRPSWLLSAASDRTVTGSQPPADDHDWAQSNRIASARNQIQFRSKSSYDLIGQTATMTPTNLGTGL